MGRAYYVDACIWLNLFKKEGDARKGEPYWKIADKFLEMAECNGDKIYYSKFVLREIKYVLNDDKLYKEKLLFFKGRSFVFVKELDEDYFSARYFETENNYAISFFDCLHIAIAKRKNAFLITRDKLLIKRARIHVMVKKPEDLFT